LCNNAQITYWRLITEKSYTFAANEANKWLSIKPSAREQRYVVATLIKEVDAITKHEIDKWDHNWNKKKRTLLVYEHDFMTKMSNIKSIDKKITESIIRDMDKRFEIVKLNICKSCRQRHKKNCCSLYARRNYTTAAFVKHAKLVK